MSDDKHEGEANSASDNPQVATPDPVREIRSIAATTMLLVAPCAVVGGFIYNATLFHAFGLNFVDHFDPSSVAVLAVRQPFAAFPLMVFIGLGGLTWWQTFRQQVVPRNPVALRIILWFRAWPVTAAVLQGALRAGAALIIFLLLFEQVAQVERMAMAEAKRLRGREECRHRISWRDAPQDLDLATAGCVALVGAFEDDVVLYVQGATYVVPVESISAIKIAAAAKATPSRGAR